MKVETSPRLHATSALRARLTTLAIGKGKLNAEEPAYTRIFDTAEQHTFFAQRAHYLLFVPVHCKGINFKAFSRNSLTASITSNGP